MLYCDGLKSVAFSESATLVPRYLLAGCPGVESVVVSDSVEEVGSYAFASC